MSVAVSTRARSCRGEEKSVVRAGLEPLLFEIEDAVTSCLGCGCEDLKDRDGCWGVEDSIGTVATSLHVGKRQDFNSINDNDDYCCCCVRLLVRR